MYELGFSMPEDGILHSQRRENLKSYMVKICFENTNNVLRSNYGRQNYWEMENQACKCSELTPYGIYGI
jgi:hypothetical protein